MYFLKECYFYKVFSNISVMDVSCILKYKIKIFLKYFMLNLLDFMCGEFKIKELVIFWIMVYCEL